MRYAAAVLALALTVVPLHGQQYAMTNYDCRAAQTLSDLHRFVTGSLAEKKAMWDDGEMFRVEEGTVGEAKTGRYLLPGEEGPFLVRFVYQGNPNGDYGVWIWGRCIGAKPSTKD